ncbi:MAG: hypothetical protein JNM65_04990 [Verrucomicrobiaceae bacterium]|nr:hypothetical protein [Verrucomicrobiaceae bacterium]
MKTLLSFASLLFLSTTAFAGPQKVMLQVHVESERGSKSSNDSKSPDESRARWLVVRVTNPSPLKMEGLTLKWTLYADDLKRGHDEVVVEKSGDENLSIEPSGRSTDVTTPKVVFEWTPQHSVRSGSGRRVSYKKVDETGHRYHGYAVQVLQNGVVIGEASSDLKLLNATR